MVDDAGGGGGGHDRQLGEFAHDVAAARREDGEHPPLFMRQSERRQRLIQRCLEIPRRPQQAREQGQFDCVVAQRRCLRCSVKAHLRVPFVATM